MSFQLPPYPYDRLDALKAEAARLPGGCLDLSIGTPIDPPPSFVLEKLVDAVAARGYPSASGTPRYREACAEYLARRFGVSLPPAQIAACVGSKEFVTGVPAWLHLRDPKRDTVLYPAISYPSYEMGAQLAGLRALPVPVDASWRLQLDQISPQDAARALCLWVNSPGNPTGHLDDLRAAATWGRAHGVWVLSDECYAEFTWDGPPQSILANGPEGVLALHSLSKRSNLAGLRVGFYAGDADLVYFLSEIRKHAGLMVPGPAQAAAVAALEDSAHVEAQRARYWKRLERLRELLARVGFSAPLPTGGFYLWGKAPGGDSWAFTRQLASSLGLLCSPGDFYGPSSADFVRVAAVITDEGLALLAQRLGA